jgi:glycosyltransferase involved in cell wall biosynthesis
MFRGFDIVLILNVANGFFLPLIKAGGSQVVTNVDGLEWKREKWSGFGKFVFRTGARATARFATTIVVDSAAMAPVWSETLGRSSRFIPYGANVLQARPTDRLQALGLERDNYCLIVARLVPENNVLLLLEAFERSRVDCELVIVGSANYRSELARTIASRAQKNRRLHCLGHIDDEDLLLDLWSHCKLYLHGHSVGGTNPALLQALGAGSPTLALDTPFNREVLRCDDQLFPPDAETAGRMIAAVADDAALRRTYSMNGINTITTRYSWDRVCEDYLQLFCKVCE